MPKIYPEEIKQKALELRKQGFTYSEIPKLVNCPVPKNTFTNWFKNIVLSGMARERIALRMKGSGSVGRIIAWKNARRKRNCMLENLYRRVDSEIKNIDKLTAKLCLAMLYLGEGRKVSEFVSFGNSDPKVIKLFLNFLRKSFDIDEKRLRGVVQCRADQDIQDLETYWSVVSGISTNQFQKAQVDKRTIGKLTKRRDYKGVFVVIYCSNIIFLELKFISDIIYKRLNLGP